MSKVKCWAAALGSCSTVQSGDHLFSAGLLGNGVKLRGAPWTKPGEVVTIGAKSFVGNVLCKTHNSDLSEVDQASIDFRAVIEHATGVREVRQKAKRRWSKFRVQVDGLRIERWCLKTICTFVASGYVKQHKGWIPPLELLKAIYGAGDLPAGCGLAVIASVGQQVQLDDRSLEFAPITGKSDGRLGGALFGFQGMRWLCTWDVPAEKVVAIDHRSSKVIQKPMYHLRSFYMKNENVIVDFSWAGKLDARGLKALEQARTNHKSRRNR